jgi:hypothetical protein
MNEPKKQGTFRRMPFWWLTVVLLIVVIWWTQPEQITIVIYKLALVAIGVVASHIADRSMYKRVEEQITSDMLRVRDTFAAARLIARAIVFFAVIEALARGM